MLLTTMMILSCAGRSGPVEGPAPASVQVQTFEHVWSLVAESYPYADMKGVDWPAVREELRPAAEAAETADALRPVLKEMLGRLGESHFGVIPGAQVSTFLGDGPAAGGAEPASAGVGADGAEPASARLVDGELVVVKLAPEGAAAEAGVARGWALDAVDGDPLISIFDGAEALPFNARLETILPLATQGRLEGAPGSEVTLSLRDADDQPVELVLTRREAAGEVVVMGALPPVSFLFESSQPRPELGYVGFNIFMTALMPPLERAISDLREADGQGLIIDLRGNPGGVAGLAAGVAGFIVDEPGKSLGQMITREADLEFRVFPRAEVQRFDGPVAVLVDELSMSTSELLAAGLQELGEARLFGATTGGMALPSRIETLPNGDRIQFAFADLFDPAGDRIEGIGVTPDAPTPLTRDALLAGGDPALDAAICWILPSDGACP